ncbi:hypothetical protein LY76DRAFT_102190 [Colletotrichum caudatum]|nr:hypothetical protein LY76DRAFT_102190 [Colletotrichum caudatum]
MSHRLGQTSIFYCRAPKCICLAALSRSSEAEIGPCRGKTPQCAFDFPVRSLATPIGNLFLRLLLSECQDGAGIVPDATIIIARRRGLCPFGLARRPAAVAVCARLAAEIERPSEAIRCRATIGRHRVTPDSVGT